jgi:mevalonate kinase
VLPDQGIGVAVECDLPIGRGMGSSAALAVALARAWSALEERVPTAERIASDAMRVERIFHGDPSGIDHTVSMTGGAVLFERGEAGPVLQTIPIPDLPLVVIDSGVASDTATMVAGVRDRRPGCDPVLAQIGALVRAFMDALPSGDPQALGRLLTDNHGLLRRLGVSTPALDAIVDAALTAGATGAKLAGAGGGGVVVALAPDSDRVIAAAQRQGHTAFAVRIAAAT